MTTRAPRLQISPSPDVSVVLLELSKLLAMPQSRIVAELLDEGLPALEMTVKAMRMVKKRPQDVEAMMSQFANRAINSLTQETMNFSEALKAKPGRKPKGSSGRKP